MTTSRTPMFNSCCFWDGNTTNITSQPLYVVYCKFYRYRTRSTTTHDTSFCDPSTYSPMSHYPFPNFKSLPPDPSRVTFPYSVHPYKTSFSPIVRVSRTPSSDGPPWFSFSRTGLSSVGSTPISIYSYSQVSTE